MTKTISADFPFESHYADVLGSKIHYIEAGAGDPILFLHGLPSSNYVWRNVIPHLSDLGRCIAPDLIGFGKSGKPDIDYTINDHINYINQFIEKLNLKNITLVLHGFGSVIGLNYLVQHVKNCKAVALYEAFLKPIDKEALSLPLQEQIALVEIEERGYDVVATGLPFINQVLPQMMMRKLSDAEMAFYQEPFRKEGTGKPLKTYWDEMPRGNGSTNVDKIIVDYAKKLSHIELPKLLLYALPGFIASIETVMWAKKTLPNLEAVEVGEAYHFAQEISPEIMGEAISVWLQSIEQLA